MQRHCLLIAAVWLAFFQCDATMSGAPLAEVIDREVEAAWQREKVTPSPVADDAEFLRRVWLDLAGSIPTYDETLAFLDDTADDKRARLIDRLLNDPRYAQHQADVWDLVFFGRNPPGYDTDKREHFQRWLERQFAENVPYDRWAAALLKAEGNSVDDGPPMFFVQYSRRPEDAIEAVTQTFLGVQLQCARCHDHPFESWKQVDFYGMAAFLSRLDVVTVGKDKQITKYAIGEQAGGDIMFTGPAKDQTPGKKGEPIKPKFLLGDALEEPGTPANFQPVRFTANQPPPAPTFSRKNELAAWIASPGNPFFARAVANRVWAQYLGRGIVHPIDNMSPANAPSHPALLDELARELVAHEFDLKWLTGELVSSRAYQRSSRGGGEAQYPRWFESARWRPLSAEELAESWRIATGYVKKSNEGRFAPLEGGYMLRFFGKPQNGVGDFQGGLQEHLYLNNGPLSSLLGGGAGSLLSAVTSSGTAADERVDRLYLALLNRRPTPSEREKMAEYVSRDKADQGWRDAIWALMTSSEFRFNH